MSARFPSQEFNLVMASGVSAPDIVSRFPFQEFVLKMDGGMSAPDIFPRFPFQEFILEMDCGISASEKVFLFPNSEISERQTADLLHHFLSSVLPNTQFVATPVLFVTE